MVRPFLSATAACFLASCAPLFETTSDSIVARGPRVEAAATHAPLRDLVRAQGFLCGSRLTLVVTELHACDERASQRVTVERRRVRGWTVPLVELGIGVAGIAAPAILYATDGLYGCSDSNPPQCTGSKVGTLAAFAGLYLGLGFVVASIVDGARAKEVREHYPSLETTNREVWCGEQPAADRTMALGAQEGPITTRLDSNGVGRIDLPASMRIAGLRFPISVDRDRLVIELPTDRCAAGL